MDSELEVILQTGRGQNSDLNHYYVHSDLLEDRGQIILGSDVNKICRFCGKDSNKTTFKKKAHIIPEFMGNKLYFSNYECDSCNDYIGNLEDSLSNFGGIFNSLSSIKGKRGFPKFKDKKEGLETFAKDNKTVVTKLDKDGNPDTIKHENGRVKFDINQPGYIPQDVLKSLVKIALLMMSNEELGKYKKAIKWIISKNTKNQENNPFFNVFRKIGGKKRFVKPWCILLQKRGSKLLQNHPHHTLILFYGIIQYQIFIPFHEDEQYLYKDNRLVLPLSEFIYTEKNRTKESVEIGYDRIALGGINKIKSKQMKFSFGFKKHN